MIFTSSILHGYIYSLKLRNSYFCCNTLYNAIFSLIETHERSQYHLFIFLGGYHKVLHILSTIWTKFSDPKKYNYVPLKYESLNLVPVQIVTTLYHYLYNNIYIFNVTPIFDQKYREVVIRTFPRHSKMCMATQSSFFDIENV